MSNGSSTPSVSDTKSGSDKKITWQVEFNERIAAFAAAVSLSEEKVHEVFSDMGIDGQSERSLLILENDEFLPASDIFHSFCDSGLTKKTLVRFGLPHLRGRAWKGDTVDAVDSTANLTDAINRMVDSNRPKSDWSDKELLTHYDENNYEVAEVLRKRTHSRPVIIYNEDGSLHESLCLELIKAAKRQPTAKRIIRNSIAYRVYRAGEFPVRPIDASPFSIGVALIDGYCPSSETDWAGVDHVARVLAHIYVFDIESVQLSKRDLNAICEDARIGVEHFRKKYPSAALRYDELERDGKLPDLKISPKSTSSLPIDNGF